jgi:hypothetical protein
MYVKNILALIYTQYGTPQQPQQHNNKKHLPGTYNIIKKEMNDE